MQYPRTFCTQAIKVKNANNNKNGHMIRSRSFMICTQAMNVEKAKQMIHGKIKI